MREELKLFFHKEVKSQEKMKDLRLLIFSTTRVGEEISCQAGTKAKSSGHCCIHLLESRKCDLFRSKLVSKCNFKWEAMNDSLGPGSSPKQQRLSRDLGCCRFSSSSLTVLLIL